MITFDHVTKSFGARRAVDALSFEAPAGRVTGFLGRNGAGKSTSLRVLCGLCRPDAGRATIAGRSFTGLRLPGRTIGVLLDAGAQHPGRTGREVVGLAALASHQPPSRCDDLLERVGLTQAASRRVGEYSLGMRQRLGLAVALAGDPVALVLDEPANGLDPEGIRWLRGLLDDFATAGGTVLLSSHILAEVQQVADRIVVLDAGRKVAEGETADLLAGPTGPLSTVDALDLPRLRQALGAAGITVGPERADGLAVSAPPERIGALAAEHRITLTRLQPAQQDLEDVFFSLI